jgi:hypothetical protein
MDWSVRMATGSNAACPILVIHADWGSAPGKRWMARARRRDGAFVLHAPERVGDPSTLLERVGDDARTGGALLGFDFPIGLPLVYARRAGITDFKAFLAETGRGIWSHFYDVAETADEISLYRPFYPKRPGGTSQRHLLEGLGVSSRAELFRVCDRPAGQLPEASPIFWTLGGKQVGKAALLGWREVLVPALASAAHVALWPFDGDLAGLLQPGRTVLAETYPAEMYRHLGVRFAAGPAGEPWGKRSQNGRRRQAAALMESARASECTLRPELEQEIEDGFGKRADGEDRFDAVVGLLGMLQVVLGLRSPGEPQDAEVRTIEGWMLGRPQGRLRVSARRTESAGSV